MTSDQAIAVSKAKAERAFVRRFGLSMLPLSVTYYAERNKGHVKVFDPETGSWAKYDVSAWRIRRVAEHDAENV